MKRMAYDEVIQFIQAHPWNFETCLDDLEAAFPDETRVLLRSILSQEYQRAVKRRFHELTSPHKKVDIYRRYQEHRASSDPLASHLLLDLANEIQFTPFLTARVVLEQFLVENGPSYQEPDHPQPPQPSHLKYLVSQLAKNPALIHSDPTLSLDVKLSHYSDELYGPVVECVKQSIGLEAEDRLKRELFQQDIAFEDEGHFRKSGCDKTPDIRVVVPFSVGGNIVNWIESKALFGDHESHAQYMKSQLYSYWNRFGPGMVIYWFGFVDDLNTEKHKGILVCDGLPKNISKMDFDDFDWEKSVDEFLESEQEHLDSSLQNLKL